MKFDDRYPWVRIAWEAFEMTLLKRGDEKYISLVGNRVKIFESKKISWNQGFDLKGGDILISSQMSEYEKAEMDSSSRVRKIVHRTIFTCAQGGTRPHLSLATSFSNPSFKCTKKRPSFAMSFIYGGQRWIRQAASEK